MCCPHPTVCATQEEDTIRYHVVLEKLLKNDLRHGLHRETLLGPSYMLGFFLRGNQVRPCAPYGPGLVSLPSAFSSTLEQPALLEP